MSTLAGDDTTRLPWDLESAMSAPLYAVASSDLVSALDLAESPLAIASEDLALEQRALAAAASEVAAAFRRRIADLRAEQLRRENAAQRASERSAALASVWFGVAS